MGLGIWNWEFGDYEIGNECEGVGYEDGKEERKRKEEGENARDV